MRKIKAGCFSAIFLIISTHVNGELLGGVQFGDDFVPHAVTPETGTAEVNISISKQFSYFAWYFLDWIRANGEISFNKGHNENKNYETYNNSARDIFQ